MPNTEVYASLIQEDLAKQSEQVQGNNAVYAELIKKDKEQERNVLNLVLDDAFGKAPDKAARINDLSKSTGLPVDLIERNYEQVHRADQAKRLNNAMAESPILRRQMRDPQFAAMAYDDVEPLIGIGGMFKFAGKSVAAGFYSLNQGLAGAGQSIIESGEQLIDPLVGRLLPANPLTPIAESIASIGKGAGTLAERYRPQHSGTWSAGFGMGIESLTQNLPLMPLALINPTLALLLMSGNMGGQGYQRAREQGLSLAQSLPYATSQAVIEFAFDRLPLHTLLRDVRVGRAVIPTAVTQVGMEVPRDQVIAILQTANDWAILPENKDKTFRDYLASLPETSAQTAIASVVGATGNTAVMKGASLVFDRNNIQAQRAKDAARLLAEFNRLAAQSKLAERAPDTFADFVEQAGGDVQDIYIESDALMQSGLGDELAQTSPAVAEQLSNNTGGLIQIPLKEYANFAKTEAANQLLDHLKTDPDGMSLAEAREYAANQRAQLDDDFNRLIKEQENSDEFTQSVEVVKSSIKSMLDDTGRFTSDVNESYSTLVGQWYAIQAANLGITPEELYNRYPLTVQGQSVLDGQVYGQDGQLKTDTQAFKNWFGDSKVVNEDGSPMVVYHGGTVGNVFDSAFSGTGSGRESGFFFTPDIRQARDYAGTGEVKEVYLSIKNPLYTDTQLSPEEVAQAKADGYDGYWIIDDGLISESEVVVFEPTQIKSVNNRGTFDPNDPSILHQNTSGLRGTFSPSTLTISLLETADLSTFLHETGHFFLEAGLDIAARADSPIALKQDAQTLLDWFGVESLEVWYGLDPEVRRSYHEQFARGFESYLFEGKSPNIEMRGLFQRFRAWLVNIYKELINLNVTLTDEVRGVMDRMLATSEQIELMEQGRSMLPIFETAEQAGMTPEEFADYQKQGIQASLDAIEQLQGRSLRDMKWLHGAHSKALKELQKEVAARRRDMRIEARREVMSQPVYRAWQYLTSKLTPDDRINNKPIKSDPELVTPEMDSLFVAIAKLGGINSDDVSSQWGLSKKEQPGQALFGKPVVRKSGGLTLDEMSAALAEEGYLGRDENGLHDINELEEKFFEELRGAEQYSVAFDYDLAQGLRDGEQLSNPDATGAGRISLNELEIDGYASETIDALKSRRMTSRDSGMHPDFIATRFGFESAQQMIEELIKAEPPRKAIETQTDLMMLARYGDVSSPRALQAAADEAVHNQVRARFTAAEANALAKVVGGKNILLSAAKGLAQDVIARVRVRDLRPSKYTSAETKAAKAADKAFKAGDIRKAATEKRNQVLQQQLAKESLAAKTEVEKVLRYLRKFNREGTRKNIDSSYIDQIDLLLDRFDLRDRSLKAVDRSTSLANWIASQREQNLEPDIDPFIEAEANRTNYKNLTMEQLRGLNDAIKQLEHLGRLKNRLLTDQKNRALDVIKDELQNQVIESATDQGREAKNRMSAQTLLDKAARIEDWRLNLMRIRDIAKVLDNGKDDGPFWQTFIRPLNDRINWENTEKAKASKDLFEILKPFLSQKQDKVKGVYYPSIGKTLTREGLISIALNMGNRGNLQRLLDGYGWRLDQAIGAISNLTPAELRAVQEIWDYIDQYRPLIAEKQKRVYGTEPQWVEPQEITVTANDGSTIKLKGGYYPIVYDPVASTKGSNIDESKRAEDMMKGAKIAATTRRTFTKERAAEVKGMPVLLSTSGLFSGVGEVLHDLALHEWVIDANRLLNSKRITDAIRDYYGEAVNKQFRDWVKDIAKGHVPSTTALDKFFSGLRHNVSPALLGMSLRTIISMPFGLAQTIPVVGAKETMRGLQTFINNPKKAVRDAMAMSNMLNNRARTRFRDLAEVRNQMGVEGKLKDNINRYAYAGMLWTQQFADTVTWYAAYYKQREITPNDEKLAIDIADQAVVDTQSGGDIKDLPRVMRTTDLGKLFTAFSIYMGSASSLALTSYMTKSKARFAADMMWLYIVQATSFALVMRAFTPGDDDKWDLENLTRAMLRENLSYLMGSAVGVRELFPIVDSAISKRAFDYSGPTGLKFISDAQRLVTQIGQGELDRGLFNATVDMMGDLTGIPSAQIKRTTQGVLAIKDGKIKNPVDAALSLGFGFKRNQ